MSQTLHWEPLLYNTYRIKAIILLKKYVKKSIRSLQFLNHSMYWVCAKANVWSLFKLKVENLLNICQNWIKFSGFDLHILNYVSLQDMGVSPL